MKWLGPVNKSAVKIKILTWITDTSMSLQLPSHHKLLASASKIIPQIIKPKLLRKLHVNHKPKVKGTILSPLTNRVGIAPQSVLHLIVRDC